MPLLQTPSMSLLIVLFSMPMTHFARAPAQEIYFPLMNVDGKPVLRIMRGGHE
jgi:hypothetical protein